MTVLPQEIVQSADVYRLPSSGSKVYPGTATTTIDVAFLPLDRRDHALEGGVYRDPAEFFTDPDANVKETDKVVIDSTTYYVKQIFTASFGGHPHKRCTISSEQ